VVSLPLSAVVAGIVMFAVGLLGRLLFRHAEPSRRSRAAAE
jgi:hypothetical protein